MSAEYMPCPECGLLLGQRGFIPRHHCTREVTIAALRKRVEELAAQVVAYREADKLFAADFDAATLVSEGRALRDRVARAEARAVRAKLKALVEEWRWNARNERIGWPEAAGLLYAADRLEDAILNSPEIPDGCAALLAESEPDIPTEPCEQFKPCAMSGKRGHPAELCGSTCETCGFAADRHEAKAKLPLGHEFVAAVDSLGRASKSSADFCGECGQPRSAHEPR